MIKLTTCIQAKRANQSRSREAVYNLLKNSDKCLNVSQIIKKSLDYYPKKISQNTIYRHINFLLECHLLIVIQDDFKRAYYAIKKDYLMVFSICPLCNNIKESNTNYFQDTKFQEADFITIHINCDNCKTKKQI